MLQAISLAVAGSFYPVGLLFVLRFLAATRPIFLAGLYLVGGAIGCLAVSIVELVLLSALPLDPVDDAGPNGAVYIVLGAGLLLIAAVYARRSRQPVTLEKKNPGEPSAARAFLTGLIVYSPGLGLIAAIKALFDAQLTAPVLTVGVIVCVVIILWMAEVPILATLISPQRSAPVLRSAGDFVARHGRLITIALAVGVGVYLLVDGALIVAHG
jgi:hypothetical protein